jgi:transcription antitermination protein NusB
MISRRLLRIKVLQVLYAYYKSDQKDLNKSEKELFFSVNKAYDLFYYILLLAIEVVDYAESRIELARNKRMPSYEDLHPNIRFVSNKFIEQLRGNRQFKRYLETAKISWANHPEFVKELYNLFIEHPEYQEYMNADEIDYSRDKKIIIRFFNDIVFPNESLHQILEEKSIYWNDDLEFVISMVIKTVKKFKEDSTEMVELPDLFKNDEDREFVKKLFRKATVYRKMSLGLIEEKASNWDLERIAFMDVLIMQLAITEMIEFRSIPTKVTLNEFLEIAKFYSTEKSNTFINGVLDKILQKLKDQKKIIKTGRGLIGEI